MSALVWHRNDLRTHDHAALHAAALAGAAAGVVILADADESLRQRALRQSAVRALRASYEGLGGVLLVRTGSAVQLLPQLAAACGANEVHALRSHTPDGMHRDAQVTRALTDAGVAMHWHDGLYMHAPGSVLTRDGRPFSVYGPYARRWLELDVAAPLDPPRTLLTPPSLPEHGIIPDDVADVPLPETGESAALHRLEQFVRRKLGRYAERRDRLDGAGLSRLSVDFTLGMLSPRTAFHRVHARGGESAGKWLAELRWRDFLADLLAHRPWLTARAFSPRFDALPWNDDERAFDAWRSGRTGVPVVDAAMRELGAAGWISNRARMIAAQFLTKHLLIHWTRGERVFRELLLDADVASNVGNWQWAAGLGVDNAPYFRVFNPVTQGLEHDPGGRWLRRWVPESGGDPRPLPHALVDLRHARKTYLDAVEALPRR